jgi:hypothetical protein
LRSAPQKQALVAVDRELIESTRSFADPDAGIRERFLTPNLGGAATVAILSTPVSGAPERGWVWCGSFGSEQGYLLPFEVALARRLAAAGHAVLRYHGQGYGDSELPADVVSLRSHRRDALDAVGCLRAEMPELRSVGMVGARLGAAVAALVATDARADAVVLVDPAVSGATYVRTLLGRSAISSLAEGGAARAESAASADATVVDLEGTLVERSTLDEISALDLAAEVTFAGRSLLLQVSRTAEPRKPLERIRDRLRELGGDPELRVVVDADALRFGLPRFRRAGGSHKVDVQAALTERLVLETVAWAGALGAARSRGDG